MGKKEIYFNAKRTRQFSVRNIFMNEVLRKYQYRRKEGRTFLMDIPGRADKFCLYLNIK